MANEGDNGGHFRFEATLRPDEDHEEAETRWYRWNKEVKRWEFYGNEMPSWDELSEGAKDALSRAYDLIFRGHYEKERGEAIGRGMNPKELPESPGTALEVLYYLDKAKKHEAHDWKFRMTPPDVLLPSRSRQSRKSWQHLRRSCGKNSCK